MDFPSGLKNDLMINFKNHCSENKKDYWYCGQAL